MFFLSPIITKFTRKLNHVRLQVIMQSQPLNIKRANIYGVMSNTGSVVRNNWKNFITWLFITFISLQS